MKTLFALSVAALLSSNLPAGFCSASSDTVGAHKGGKNPDGGKKKGGEEDEEENRVAVEQPVPTAPLSALS